MKILTICPTKGRPELFQEMVKSFYQTASLNNCLLAVVDPSDPWFYEYMMTPDPRVHFLEVSGTVTQAVNHAYEKYSHFNYYHIANDDALYHTQHWDQKFIQMLHNRGPGIAYGDDLFQGENLCTFPFISAQIVKAVGWLQLPALTHYCGDVVWKFLGTNAECLHYLPEIVIEHKWGGADEDINKADMAKFAQWLKTAHMDIERIRKVSCHKQNFVQ